MAACDLARRPYENEAGFRFGLQSLFTSGSRHRRHSAKYGDRPMIVTVLAAALAIGQAVPAAADSRSSIQQVQYGVPRHPPPCGDGWDLSARDGLCYPNGFLAPQDQDAYYRRGYGDYPRARYSRYPVPCGGDGVDLDLRDGRCYPTGTVPRRFQDRPENYYRY